MDMKRCSWYTYCVRFLAFTDHPSCPPISNIVVMNPKNPVRSAFIDNDMGWEDSMKCPATSHGPRPDSLQIRNQFWVFLSPYNYNTSSSGIFKHIKKGFQRPLNLGMKWYNWLAGLGSPNRQVANRDSNSDLTIGCLKALSHFTVPCVKTNHQEAAFLGSRLWCPPSKPTSDLNVVIWPSPLLPLLLLQKQKPERCLLLVCMAPGEMVPRSWNCPYCTGRPFPVVVRTPWPCPCSSPLPTRLLP